LQIILRAQSGDREAFTILFEQYKNLVYKTAYLMLGESKETSEAPKIGWTSEVLILKYAERRNRQFSSEYGHRRVHQNYFDSHVQHRNQAISLS
jgi:hypothetical protein